MANSIILNKLLEKLRYSINEFEIEIGVPAGRLYKAIDRGTQISLDTVQKIITKFPNVNREWLLTGEGNMFIEEIKKDVHTPNSESPVKGDEGQESVPGEIVDSSPQLNKGENDLMNNMLESLIRAHEKYATAAINHSIAAKDNAKAHLLLTELYSAEKHEGSMHGENLK